MILKLDDEAVHKGRQQPYALPNSPPPLSVRTRESTTARRTPLPTRTVLDPRAMVQRVRASRRSARTGGGQAGPDSPSRVTGAARQSLSVADRPG
jgi:hypothetical protein